MNGKVGRASSCQHHIPLKEAQPVQQQPFHLPHMYKDAVEKEIDEMIKERVINLPTVNWLHQW